MLIDSMLYFLIFGLGDGSFHMCVESSHWQEFRLWIAYGWCFQCNNWSSHICIIICSTQKYSRWSERYIEMELPPKQINSPLPPGYRILRHKKITFVIIKTPRLGGNNLTNVVKIKKIKKKAKIRSMSSAFINSWRNNWMCMWVIVLFTFERFYSF